MTKDERDQVLARLQSIATLAIDAQGALDGQIDSDKLATLQDALEDIKSDRRAAVKVLETYTADPTAHVFKASAGFSDCCKLCGESEAMHEAE